MLLDVPVRPELRQIHHTAMPAHSLQRQDDQIAIVLTDTWAAMILAVNETLHQTTVFLGKNIIPSVSRNKAKTARKKRVPHNCSLLDYVERLLVLCLQRSSCHASYLVKLEIREMGNLKSRSFSTRNQKSRTF
mgnify:CR=1 FL=1